MPFLQPAERCCGHRSLLQGVQLIASYTVVVGTFGVLSFLVGSTENEHQSETAAILQCLHIFMNSFALYAGLKGLIGVIIRDSQRLRVLMYYQMGDLVVSIITFVVKEITACEELKRLQQKHKGVKVSCSSARVALGVEFCMHFLLFAYFLFIIWSLLTRLESGQADLLAEHELAERGAALGLGDPWLFVGPPMGTEDASSALLRRSGSGNGNGRGAQVPQPFSGPAQSLPTEPPGMPEPFSGTAYRLE
eukprot:TRINITY_DN47908_c0_g1_i1.p1 TRINITY_DN47908_c0_g1~~TRINITY_DN47908_c0_g1_i1.p1  ORF type:complete len:263 (+),score=47.36 TRINITY_DN47908_c0_g1_i1:43-789(+)